MDNKELGKLYKEWIETPYYDFLYKESIKLRPDIQEIFIEQMLFKHWMVEIVKQPIPEGKIKEPTEFTLKNCKIYENEEDYNKKNPDVKQIQPKNLPEGKSMFEFEGIDNPLPENLLKNDSN